MKYFLLPFVLFFLITVFSFSIFSQEKEQQTDNATKFQPQVTKDISQESQKPTEQPTTINVTQFVANDNNFRGISVYGDPLSRRNNTPLKSYNDAWHLASLLFFNTEDSKFSANLFFFNPIQNRTDRDVDFRLQDKKGGIDKTNQVLTDLQTQRMTFDPNSTKMRKEQNALGDLAVGEFYYNWKNSGGSFSTGLMVFANFGNANRFATADYAFIWKTPFLATINPTLFIYYKFTSEFGGAGNGTVYSKLAFSYEFFKDEMFRITPAVHLGYQYVNNVTDQRQGISDINSSLQFSLDRFFLKFVHVHRPDTYIWDNGGVNPQTGAYPDRRPNDGRVTDPSKINGSKNQFIIDQISGFPVHDEVKRSLSQDYQQQNIIKNIFIIQMGYSIKI